MGKLRDLGTGCEYGCGIRYFKFKTNLKYRYDSVCVKFLRIKHWQWAMANLIEKGMCVYTNLIAFIENVAGLLWKRIIPACWWSGSL